MELNTFDREPAMAQSHNHARAVGFPGLRADLQLLRQALFGDNQRMVARGGHGRWGILEQGPTVMADLADLAVHDLAGAHHVAAEGHADGLMPQADTEHWLLSGKVANQIDADARLLRRARARRNHNVAGPHGFYLLRGNLIVAAHLNFFPQFTQILDQVVGEGVVVVEDEDHAGSTHSVADFGDLLIFDPCSTSPTENPSLVPSGR